MTRSVPISAGFLASKAELIKRRHELRADVRAQFADHDDPRVMALRNRLEDTDDWAVASEMVALDIALVSRDVSELADVEAALARIADGTYGVCVDCDRPIAPARLSANPSARRCSACQEQAEKAGGARPAL